MTSIQALSRATVVGLAGCVAASGWSLATELGRAHYADQALSGTLSVHTTREGWDHRVMVADDVALALLVVTGILFIAWHYQVLRRLERVLSHPLRHSPGWAISGWFVPLLNLVRPKQMVDDTWRATNQPDERPRRVPLYFHVWWAAWVLSEIVTAVVTNAPGTGLSELARNDRIAAFADGLTVLAGLLAIALVLSLTRRQDRLPEAMSNDAMWRQEQWFAGLDTPSDSQNRGGSK